MKYPSADEYNVFNNTLKESENVLMTFDNVLYIKEFGFIKYLLDNKDEFKDKLRLELFDNISDSWIIRYLLERKEKDIIKWLSKDESYNNYLYKIMNNFYDNQDDKYKGVITDFAMGFLKLLCNKNIKKVLIAANLNNKNELSVLSYLFNEFLIDKVSVFQYDEDTMKEYLSSKEYTLIITDELDLLNDNIELLTGKSVCIPYTGYNFDIKRKKFKLDSADIITSKHEMEFKSAKYKFNLGFIEPINMTPEMFYEG